MSNFPATCEKLNFKILKYQISKRPDLASIVAYRCGRWLINCGLAPCVIFSEISFGNAMCAGKIAFADFTGLMALGLLLIAFQSLQLDRHGVVDGSWSCLLDRLAAFCSTLLSASAVSKSTCSCMAGLEDDANAFTQAGTTSASTTKKTMSLSAFSNICDIFRTVHARSYPLILSNAELNRNAL